MSTIIVTLKHGYCSSYKQQMYALAVYEKIKELVCFVKLCFRQLCLTYLRQISRLSSGNFSQPEDRFHRRIFALDTEVIETGDQA